MDRNTELELNEVERIKIDRLYDRLQRITYYEMLNLPSLANKSQIKKSYYSVSKEFHPDRYFRRNLGDYKEKLEAIFDLITKAYNTLNDDEARSEYDRSLIEDSFRREPDAYEVALDFGGGSSAAASSSAQGRSAGSASEPVIGRPVGHSAASVGAPSIERMPTVDPTVRPVFMDRFQRQLMERMIKAREYFKAGKESFARGNYPQAMASLQFACTFDPRNQEARELLEQTTELVNEAKAEGHYQRGLQVFKKAVDCKPKKGYYYYRLGHLLQETEAERKVGLEQYKLAVQFDPKNIDYRMVLAKAFEEFRMPRNAVREYEKILSLDRSNEVAQKMLKRLKAAL